MLYRKSYPTSFMDVKQILQKLSITGYPIGLGGCKSNGLSFDCCEYNITIFDDKKENDSVLEVDGNLVKLHHGSLKEEKPEILTQYQGMQILLDEQWDLKIFLSKINEKKIQIVNSYTKSCLVDAGICITKVRDGLENSDPFASSWLKCACYFICDAISLVNQQRPSPTHMLEYLRGFEKSRLNETLSVVDDCIGIERATASLLSRMCKSTIGFLDLVENNGNSKIILNKYRHLTENSLLSDCYFYLGYINRNNFIKIKNDLHRRPELIHILKVAFDTENDLTKIQQDANSLQKSTNALLEALAV